MYNIKRITTVYDIDFVAHKSFTCKAFDKNRGFSYEQNENSHPVLP